MSKSKQVERSPPTAADLGCERTTDVARPRVLLVDDDANHRNLLSLALVESGYDVVEAEDGAGAIDYLLRNPSPSVMLLDLIMPGLSGWDVLAVVRSYVRLRRVPVIVVTGEAAALQVPGANVVGLMRKPVPLRDLLALMRRHIRLPDP